jgi:Inosine-uridine preferring nucleoside hydrolase
VTPDVHRAGSERRPVSVVTRRRIPSLWGPPAVVIALVAALLFSVFSAGPPAAALQSGGGRAAVPRIIIDSDLSLWWDDATAIGMANVLEQRGHVRILGIMSDIRNPLAVAAMDAIDTAYGHPHIPLGAVAHSAANTAPHGYTNEVVKQLPHSVRSSSDVPGAVALYRRLLASQPDHSVTIVALGAYTNLAGLLHSHPDQHSHLDGRSLIRAKVKRLVIEDGLFPNGGPAVTNQKLDPASAKVVVEGTDWPTPIAWVDGFTGIQTRVGGALCTTVAAHNPMRIVYEALFKCGPPGDGDWDGPTMLYAIGGAQGLFTELGQGGAAYINAEGGLSWRRDPDRPHDLYVHVADQQVLNRRINALIDAK